MQELMGMRDNGITTIDTALYKKLFGIPPRQRVAAPPRNPDY
jgi:hypothetical protein